MTRDPLYWRMVQRFLHAYAKEQALLAQLAAARAELRLAENALSPELGYCVPVRGPSLVAALNKIEADKPVLLSEGVK